MDWVECKSVRVVGPEFADGFVGCEAPKGLESSGEVVGCDEVRQVRFELFVRVVEEAFDGGFLDGRFIRSTCPLVQGWLGWVRRWPMP